MQDSQFNPMELVGFNTHVENVHLDKYLKHGTNPFCKQDGWKEATVHIRLPVERTWYANENDAPTLAIGPLFHRRLTDIIKTVCTSKLAETFNFTPYTMHWSPNTDRPEQVERIYGDTYMSDAMYVAQIKLNNLPRADGDSLERVALGLMMASDSAQLTNFGSASVWPIYMMFANQPKQQRVKPSCHAVHHLAYVPTITYSRTIL